MTCPTCRRRVEKRADNKHYPFCGERCHLVDLGRWLGEDYRIPAEPLGDLPSPDDEGA